MVPICCGKQASPAFLFDTDQPREMVLTSQPVLLFFFFFFFSLATVVVVSRFGTSWKSLVNLEIFKSTNIYRFQDIVATTPHIPRQFSDMLIHHFVLINLDVAIMSLLHLCFLGPQVAFFIHLDTLSPQIQK